MNDWDKGGMTGKGSQVDFGYQRVTPAVKRKRVDAVFSRVAGRYDLMNDAMSGGLHRLWKRFAIARLRVRPGQRVLDLAAGTGDLTGPIARRVGAEGVVAMVDRNHAMLSTGRDRLLDAGFLDHLAPVQADAERLPYADGTFDRAIIGFGLRNVTHKESALAELYRVLGTGGRLVVLEFSRCNIPGMREIYDAYSMHVIPRLGRLIAGDPDSYRYLVESIRRHPDQATLTGMLEEAGFEKVLHHDLAGGAVACHCADRLA